MQCHQCRGDLKSARYSATHQMLIDGKLYPVPVHAVPCHYCDVCNTHVTTAEADEAIYWWRQQYMQKHNLNTLPRRIYRVILRRFRRFELWLYYGLRLRYRQARNR